jgi:transposase
MIAADKRKAVFLLHQDGMSVREIARRLGLSRNTVRSVIAQEGAMPKVNRLPRHDLDPDLLRNLHAQCQGWIQRMHEKLHEEHGIQIKYSTLTRRLRELGITHGTQPRCERVPDEPGTEMQHDTSVYTLPLAAHPVRLVASLLYLRYSKRRYLRFYRSFDRFKMKCFLHRALMHWGYSPKQCIIDNTNLARLRGIGARAIIVAEMEAFARQYGFQFVCHEKGHADRKAGEERSFWTVETNFLAGRSFQSLEDLNQQALDWATVRLEHRPQGKARLIPAKAFEHEQAFLAALAPHLPAPYQVEQRSIDEYGYVAFDANYYWTPQTQRDQVTVLVYEDRLRLCQAGQMLVEYALAPDGVRNQLIYPPGGPPPRHQPHNRHHSSDAEEKRLRALDPSVGLYLDACLQTPGLQRHVFVRRLLAFSQKISPELLVRSVQRAHHYRIHDLQVLERIAGLLLTQGVGEAPAIPFDEAFEERATYREGSLTDPPDLSRYDE